MKKILHFALLIFVVLGLPVTAAHAQTMQPGCNPMMWGYLEDQANTARARNRAYEREILNRQESALYLTCFDQAMVVSAKLGAIFSDNILPGPLPANTVVFTAPLAYPDWGASQFTLAMDLNAVVNPEFNNWLSAPITPAVTAALTPPEPAVALFNFLPQWLEQSPIVLTNQLTLLAAAQAVAITGITTFMGTDASEAASYNSQVTTINTFVQSLPTIPLDSLPGEVTQYETELSTLMTLESTIVSTRSAAMAPLLASLKSAFTNFPFTCTRVDDLWDKLDPAYVQSPPGNYQAGTFYPPASTTYYPFTPYYTLADFLGLPPPPPAPQNAQAPVWQSSATPPATTDFIQELGDATDNAALALALNDLEGPTGPLSQAGQNAIWPVPPTFTPPPGGLTAQKIIEQM